jgi:hypothetical protein
LAVNGFEKAIDDGQKKERGSIERLKLPSIVYVH